MLVKSYGVLLTVASESSLINLDINGFDQHWQKEERSEHDL